MTDDSDDLKRIQVYRNPLSDLLIPADLERWHEEVRKAWEEWRESEKGPDD